MGGKKFLFEQAQPFVHMVCKPPLYLLAVYLQMVNSTIWYRGFAFDSNNKSVNNQNSKAKEVVKSWTVIANNLIIKTNNQI